MARHTENQPDNLTQRELVITRVLDAPREAVWDLCTERAHAMEWWGPKNFTVSAFEMDLRPGGTWRAVIRSPEGKDYPQHGTYQLVGSTGASGVHVHVAARGPRERNVVHGELEGERHQDGQDGNDVPEGALPFRRVAQLRARRLERVLRSARDVPRAQPRRSGAAGLRAQPYSYVNHAVAVAAVSALTRTQCAAKPSGNRCTTASPAGRQRPRTGAMSPSRESPLRSQT